VLVVFGVGAVVVWQRSHEAPPTAVAVTPPQVEEPVRHEAGNSNDASSSAHGRETIPVVANETPKLRKSDRRVASIPKRTVSSIDFSSERANVVSNTRPAVNNAPVFPIEASSQSVKISLDDGRGNARTISFPTVSFGSQRVLPTTANQLAPKGEW
jgi:hypothetical protein